MWNKGINDLIATAQRDFSEMIEIYVAERIKEGARLGWADEELASLFNLSVEEVAAITKYVI